MTALPSSPIRYEPVPEPDDEATIVRRTLRVFALDEQCRGAIPAYVAADELYAAVEPYVPRLVHTLCRSPRYPYLTSTAQVEAYLQQLLRSLCEQP